MSDGNRQDGLGHLDRLARYFHENLTNEARTYLHTRGITDKTIDEFGIGYDAGLSQLGSALKYCVVFPVRDASGTIRDLAGRLINEDAAGRQGVWRNLLQPPPAMFNESAIADSDEVFLCEGPLDALALVQTGYPAVGVLDTARFQERFVDLLKDKKVFICYDNDEDGRRQRTRTAVELSAAAVHAVYTVSIPEDYNDVSELFADAPARGERPEKTFKEAVGMAIDEGVYSRLPADIKSASAFFHEFLRRNRGQHRPPSTGLDGLDGLLFGGLWEGLYVVAGRPGTGKTALLRQLATEVARQSTPVLFISLETGAYELWAASIARESGVRFADVYSGVADPDTVRKANQTFRSFSGFLWTIEIGSAGDDKNGNLDDLVRTVSREVGKTPIVLIDHYQGEEDQGLRIRNGSRSYTPLELKRLSRDAAIPIVVSHSLFEPASDSASPSGRSGVSQVGFTCDVYIEMEITESSVRGSDPDRDLRSVDVHVTKNRGSRPGATTLELNMATGRFG